VCNGETRGGDEMRKIITLVLMMLARAAAAGPAANAAIYVNADELWEEPWFPGGGCCSCMCSQP
jgi:hypothetical protein